MSDDITSRASGAASPMAAHTPTPWATNGTRIESEAEHGWANDGWIICDCLGPEATANAALIVHRVNTWDALVGALSDFADMPCEMPGAEDVEPGCCRTCRARAALHAARQEKDR